MLMFFLWWCFDDHLAEALDAPGLGELPVWVPLLVGLGLSFTVSANARDRK